MKPTDKVYSKTSGVRAAGNSRTPATTEKPGDYMPSVSARVRLCDRCHPRSPRSNTLCEPCFRDELMGSTPHQLALRSDSGWAA